MEFISTDLIGEFYLQTSKGHRYALTVVDMLTSFVSCAPLKSKKAKEIVQTYLNEAYYRFRGSRKILSDNGTEFKNKVFQEVLKNLDVKSKLTYHHTNHSQMVRLNAFISS